MPPLDPTSLANTDAFCVKHLDWSIKIDFAKKVLHCTASFTVECLRDDVSELVLDNRDLSIRNIRIPNIISAPAFKIGKNREPFGTPLIITVPADLGKKGLTFQLVIDYETSPEASALQWLNPEQTAGKKEPYLFTQCQAIHARSIVPCQDTPSVKFSYSAEVVVPKQLTALMSAVKGEEREGQCDTKICNFQQKVPIPSYLLALVVGALESRKVGPRSLVWSEKEVVDSAAFEFAETEKFIAAAESLVGDYVWGSYDLLILPPSFPYGGMENPCLTFCTPTLLAGDRSLTGVVAHEIAHSWTGNLVTNGNWEHFWLNEGFTRFLEAKIIGLLQGEKTRQMHAIAGWNYLLDAVEKFGKDSPLTALVPRLEGVDPDDAFSSIPYEKGFAFLYYIESLVGGPAVFNEFLRSYIEHFKYQTVLTEDFRLYLSQYFAGQPQEEALKSIDWETWLNGLGMPPVSVVDMYDTSLVDEAKALAVRWTSASEVELQNFSKEDIKGFSPAQVEEFLSTILQEESFGDAKVRALGTTYTLGESGNCEIRFRWLRLCAKYGVSDENEAIKKFLIEQGRMKYVRPLYRELSKTISGKELAKCVFQGNRQTYHRICENMIAKDLGVA